MVVYRRETRHWSIVLLLAFLSLVLVTLDTNGNGLINSLRNVTRDAFAPIRNGVEDAFDPIRDATSGITKYGAIKDQNTKLKRELAAAKGALQRNRAVGSRVSELERL